MKQLSTIGLEQVILTLFKRASDNKIRASLSTIANIVNSDKDKVRYAILNLIEDNKITRYEDSQSGYYSVVNDIEVSAKLHDIKPKLFDKDLHTKHFAIIKVLERYCVGYDKRKQTDFIIFQCDFISGIKIKDDVELRKLVGEIRDSQTYLRIIGSAPDGMWLALQDDSKDANAYMWNRTSTSIERLLRNGFTIEKIYSLLNELKNEYYPVHDQTRHQFNSEKTLIKRYSDDIVD